MRRVTSLATPAFLASAAGSLSLQDQILEVCTCQTDSHFTSYLTQWSASFGPPPDPMPSKQSFWDQPGILEDRSTIQASLVDQSQMACYLASVAPHSGDWLLALPIANCGLRLDDEAVRVAVGMRLGLTLCVPHKCHCGSDVDAQGRHAMVCKKAPGRVARHQVLNDIILRAINAADVPAVKEPSGLNRQDGKRPDGLSLIPWQSGKPLLWVVAVASTLAGSLRGHSRDWSRTCSRQKDSQMRRSQSTVCFQPVSVENLGPFSSSTLDFLRPRSQNLSYFR